MTCEAQRGYTIFLVAVLLNKGTTETNHVEFVIISVVFGKENQNALAEGVSGSEDVSYIALLDPSMLKHGRMQHGEMRLKQLTTPDSNVRMLLHRIGTGLDPLTYILK